MRGEIWERSAQTKGAGPVYIDIDASLVEIHSENKQQTAATYKGGFRFPPKFLLRPMRPTWHCLRCCALATPATTPSPITSWRSTAHLISCPSRAGTPRGQRPEPRRASGRLPDRLGGLDRRLHGGPQEWQHRLFHRAGDPALGHLLRTGYTSCHRHGAGSSASSTGSRPPIISSRPTDGSSSSPERSRSALCRGRPSCPDGVRS